MIKNIRTEEILEAFNILNGASYKKLDDGDKIRLWKIARLMKPVAKKFEEDSKDAAEKMKPENLDEGLEKAKTFEQKKKEGDEEGLPMSEQEYHTFLAEVWNPFNKLVAKAIREFAEKEVELDFEPLSEEAFGKLMASNDWTMDKAMVLGAIIIE